MSLVSICIVLFCFLILSFVSFFFFFNDTATTEIYTLSLHDALPISGFGEGTTLLYLALLWYFQVIVESRSEEHTSELQSLTNLVCRLLLEKKKKNSQSKTQPITMKSVQ